MKKYLSAVLLVVGLGVGFGSGYYYKSFNQQKQFSQMRNGGGFGARPSGSGIPRGITGATDGEVISVDDKSITVKVDDGSTKIIFLSKSTSYSNLQEAKKDDLKTGVKISIFGKTNSDGSLTADRIQFIPN